MKKFDTAIVGAGLTGAAMALGLSQYPGRAALIEARDVYAPINPPFRAISLSWHSLQILLSLGLSAETLQQWSAVREVVVSRKGYFGKLTLNCDELGLPLIGRVVPIKTLMEELLEKVLELSAFQIFSATQLSSISRTPDNGYELTLSQGKTQQTIRTDSLLIADGGCSQTARQLGYQWEKVDYQQNAIVVPISTDRDNACRAYERFTGNGLMAVVPLGSNEAALILTLPGKQSAAAVQISEKHFIAMIYNIIGTRIGTITKLQNRFIFPLHKLQVEHMSLGRSAVLGNSAHTLYPGGGQNFNLTLRDISWLSQLILQSKISPNIGQELLQNFANIRAEDIAKTAALTDRLATGYSAENPLMQAAVQLGLIATDLSLTLKRQLILRFSRGIPPFSKAIM